MHTANPNQTAAPRLPLSQWVTERKDTIPARLALAVAASLFVALCAHASIRLPFTPVPITLSDFAVLLVGLTLGPATASAALVLYLAEGAGGLPVFNPGPGGLLQLFGFTGGYLLAYPVAATVASLISRRFAVGSRFVSNLTAATIATTIIMTSGVIWLTLYTHQSLAAAFWLGAVPFLPGQIVKVLSAAGIVTSLNTLRRP